MKVIVLGCGLVGGPMAVDLATDFEVSVADISPEALARFRNTNITAIPCDLSDPDFVSELVKDYDIVLNAVPGFMGYRTLEAIIKAGKNVVDIAFFPEDPFALENLALEKNVIAIVDCGIAQGMSNILTGYVDFLLDETHTAITYVGGLPVIREYPYEYKAVFSPYDVIEEYIRPARYIENGEWVTRPALSDAELINFPGIGTLEAFNSDGMRTLGKTIRAKNIKEKTLRYPGHIEKIAVLRETGFFSKEEIEIKGIKISPLEFTAKLLFPKWQLKPGEEDLTVMKVMVEGMKSGKMLRYEWNLFDRYDKNTATHSMARTTGYTATAALRMMIQKKYTRAGLNVPEYIGRQPECVKFLLTELAQRNVHFTEQVTEI